MELLNTNYIKAVLPAIYICYIGSLSNRLNTHPISVSQYFMSVRFYKYCIFSPSVKG